ncbi:MAG: ThiF family adenylyltransferase [Deltaproteobacteria bacterium]|nr:ThiF family adenylyltransferase [Deltaproteobacteria bacterium]
MSRPAPILTLVGLGGLGCPALLSIAEASARLRLPLTIRLVDPDVVEASNLARQFLFSDRYLGAPKVLAARAAITRLVPSAPLTLEPQEARFDASTADALLAGAALFLDGTDDVATRFFANDTACARRLPLVHGAAVEWTGQVLTIVPGQSACLRCLFEAPPKRVVTCAEAGVVSPLTGLVGAAMASEALALLQGTRSEAQGSLLRWEGLDGKSRKLPLRRDPGCPACARC